MRSAPATTLNEAEISTTLGIGRTPVHQALDRLMVEGLVQVLPRKGIIVKPISLDEALRVTIDGAAAQRELLRAATAADRASAAEMDELTAILELAEKELETRDGERLMRLDRDFHGVLARSARNPVLTELLGFGCTGIAHCGSGSFAEYARSSSQRAAATSGHPGRDQGSRR